MDLSVSSSSWYLGRAAICDCGTPWTFLVLFYVKRRLTVTFNGVYEHRSSHKIHNNALTNHNFSNPNIWEPFEANMPNLRRVVRLPQKLKHLKEVLVEQFLEGQLVEVRPFSWWGYCLITLGIVTSVVMGILIYHKWGDTVAGCLLDALMKSGNRGARARVWYSSDPCQEMAEPPSPEGCKSYSRYKQKNTKGCDDAQQQKKALLNNGKTTIEPDSQESMGGIICLLSLQPTYESTSAKE